MDRVKALVTGGAGFIGSHLVDLLVREGFYVRVIDNLTNGKIENLNQHTENNNFEFYRGNVTDPFDLARVMKDIDIVFHLACLGVRHSIKHPFENHRVNAEGTLFTLEEAKKAGVKKFIYCSSSEVYGTAQYVPMTENHPTYPHTVYGASKLAGEAYTRAYNNTYGMNTLIIRPFNTYGPRSHYEGDAGEMIPKSIIRALYGKPILVFGDGSQTRDFTYVSDTARGLLEASKCDELIGGTFNIGANAEISIKELAEMIKDLTGNKEVEVICSKSRPGDVLRLYADSGAFCRLTDWKSEVSFKEGLLDTIKWFKSLVKSPGNLLKEEIPFNWE